MTSRSETRCRMLATVIERRGKGWLGIPDVRCIREAGHQDLPGDNDREFLTSNAHTFGIDWDKKNKRWVSRR